MIRASFHLAALFALGLAACHQNGATAQDVEKTDAAEVAATPAADATPAVAAKAEAPQSTATADAPVIINTKVSPSFDCTKAKPGSIDVEICASPELSQLDRDMDEDYMRAMAETPRAVWPDILAEQREFIRSRNRCMGGKEKRHHCIAFSYESRIQRLADWIDGSWRE